MKSFSSSWIEHLNSTSDQGVFVKIAQVTLPTTTLYLADTQAPLTFNGQVYQPRAMTWEGWEQTSQQSLPTIQVTVTDIDGVVGDFLERTNVLGLDVVLGIVHEDLLGTVTDVESVRLSIMAVDWQPGVSSTFHVGLDLALSELLPKGIITASEFPGVPESLRRASIL